MPNQACRTSGIGRTRSCWAGPCHRTRVRIRQPRRRARSRIERFGVSRRCGGFPAHGCLPAMQGCLGAGVPATWVPRKSGGAAMETVRRRARVRPARRRPVGSCSSDPRPARRRSGRDQRLVGATGRGRPARISGEPVRGGPARGCWSSVSQVSGLAGPGVGRFWGRPVLGSACLRLPLVAGSAGLRASPSCGSAAPGGWPVLGVGRSPASAGLRVWSAFGSGRLSALPASEAMAEETRWAGGCGRAATPTSPRRPGPTTAAGPDHHRFVSWPPR